MTKRNKKYNPNKHAQRLSNNASKRSVPLTMLTPRDVKLKIMAKQVIAKNSFPEINDKREGCKYGGWMEISMAARSPEWRVQKMKFFGDWCGRENLEKILPEIIVDKQERTFYIDPKVFWVNGAQHDVETLTVVNPKNMDDLERQVKAYCAGIAFDEGLLLDLDKCYYEVRA